MKIRQIFILQMILCTTATLITGAQAMDPTGAEPIEDDFLRHVTRVGEMTIPHTPTVGPEIPAGTVIFFDACLRPQHQLNLKPQGKIIYYECPAVEGVKGLEKSRSMGYETTYCTQKSDPTFSWELISASWSIPDPEEHVFTGFYHPLGTLTLSSNIENDQRIDIKRLICSPGQDMGMHVTFEYKEITSLK